MRQRQFEPYGPPIPLYLKHLQAKAQPKGVTRQKVFPVNLRSYLLAEGIGHVYISRQKKKSIAKARKKKRGVEKNRISKNRPHITKIRTKHTRAKQKSGWGQKAPFA